MDKEKNLILNKHLGVIHNSAPLSLIQRKITNILLKNAESNISKDIEHKISIVKITNAIGWNAKSSEQLRNSLKSLVEIQIQWNILEQDRKFKWTASTLLSSVSIKEGYVYYTYSQPLRKILFNPNIYAKLDLSITQKFKHTNAIVVWEFIQGEKPTKDENSFKTRWLKYEELLKLMFLENTLYQYRYTDYINKVLKKVLSEINLKSGINVSYEVDSSRGKIELLRFVIEKKPMQEEIIFQNVEQTLLEKIIKIVQSKKMAEQIKDGFNEIEINNAIDFFNRSLEEGFNPVNPVAYFKKCLKEGWVKLDKISHQNIQRKEKFNDLELANYYGKEKLFRQNLLNKYGLDIYASWFRNIELKEQNNILEISSESKFTISYIEDHYINDVIDIAIKSGYKHVECNVK